MLKYPHCRFMLEKVPTAKISLIWRCLRMNLTQQDELMEKQKLKKTQDFIDKEIQESEDRLERGFEDYDFDDYADDFMKAALREKFNQRIKNLKMVRRKPIFCKSRFCRRWLKNKGCFLFG